eukprot:3569860-Alexandrium_andersonii.AAC.1
MRRWCECSVMGKVEPGEIVRLCTGPGGAATADREARGSLPGAAHHESGSGNGGAGRWWQGG